MDARQRAILDWVHAKSPAQATDAVVALALLGRHETEERMLARGVDYHERHTGGYGYGTPDEWEPEDLDAEPWGDGDWARMCDAQDAELDAEGGPA